MKKLFQLNWFALGPKNVIELAKPWLLAFAPMLAFFVLLEWAMPGKMLKGVELVSEPLIVYFIMSVFFLGVLACVHIMIAITRDQICIRSIVHGTPAFQMGASHGISPYLNQLLFLLNQKKSQSNGHQRDELDLCVEQISNDYSARLQLPNFLAGSLVGVGLVGTFVGLISTLDDLSKLFSTVRLDSAASQDPLSSLSLMLTRLQGPMQGMGTAFVTSLYGLVGSLLLSLCVLSVNKYARGLIQIVDRLIRQLIGYASEPVSSEKWLSHTVAKSDVSDYPDIVRQLMAMTEAASEREKKVDILLSRLMDNNVEVSKGVLDGSQLLLNQFVTLQNEQNSNVLLLSQQLKHQQTTLVAAIEKMMTTFNIDDKISQSLVQRDLNFDKKFEKIIQLLSIQGQRNPDPPAMMPAGDLPSPNQQLVQEGGTKPPSKLRRNNWLPQIFQSSKADVNAADMKHLIIQMENRMKMLDDIVREFHGIK